MGDEAALGSAGGARRIEDGDDVERLWLVARPGVGRVLEESIERERGALVPLGPAEEDMPHGRTASTELLDEGEESVLTGTISTPQAAAPNHSSRNSGQFAR